MSKTIAAALLVAASTLAGCSREPATPEARRAKAEELLKTMSASLAAAKAIEVDTTEVSDRVRRDGEVKAEPASRHIAVRRPDGAYFKLTGEERGFEAWYDGKRITLALHKDKAWARGPMPATLDEALDFMATEYAIFLGAADLFYSNPYEAFDSSESTGGWVGLETVEGASCHHLSFQATQTDWEIWLADTPQALPCRIKFTYKQEPGSPTSTTTFTGWNLTPTLADDVFTAKVDPAYERLYLARAPTAEPTEDESAEDAADTTAAPTPAPAPAAPPSK